MKYRLLPDDDEEPKDRVSDKVANPFPVYVHSEVPRVLLSGVPRSLRKIFKNKLGHIPERHV